MSRLVLFTTFRFDAVHLKKDVGLFPVFLRMRYFDVTEILYFGIPNGGSLPEEYRGVKLKKYSEIKKTDTEGGITRYQTLKLQINIIRYLLQNRDVSHVMFFHYNFMRLFLVIIIKTMFPTIKVYLKLDTSELGAIKIIESLNNDSYSILKLLKRSLLRKGLKNIDLITCETNSAYERLMQDKIFTQKLFIAPNGYDDELFDSEKTLKKHKTIITVGRFGSHPKNTELLLDVCQRLDFKGWQFKFIGPMTTEFEEKTKCLYINKPELRNKIEFTGMITDSRFLTEEYRKASVFVLSSRYEGSPLVLVEAAINGCFICSTEVGCIHEISTLNNYCYIAPESKQGQQNEEVIISAFVTELQNIIDGNIDISKDLTNRVFYYREHLLMSSIIDNDFFKSFCK